MIAVLQHVQSQFCTLRAAGATAEDGTGSDEARAGRQRATGSGPVGEGLTWDLKDSEGLSDPTQWPDPTATSSATGLSVRKGTQRGGATFASSTFSNSQLLGTLVDRGGKSQSGSSPLVGRSGKSVSAATMRKAFQSLGSNPNEELELEDVVVALHDKVPPNQLLQLIVVTRRAALKQFRDFYPTAVLDCALLLSAACVVGAIHGTGWGAEKAASNAVMAMTTLATLTGVTFLRTFVKVWPNPHSMPC